VTVAIAELAGELDEGLLAFAVGAGLKVLDVILESEATAIAGPKGRHVWGAQTRNAGLTRQDASMSLSRALAGTFNGRGPRSQVRGLAR
jgi:hypothetical protein